jgi:hypothetical protein
MPTELQPVEPRTELPKSVDFQHAFFQKLEGLFFRRSDQTGEPVAMIKLGDTEVALNFRGIKKELKLEEDDPDAVMLNLVAEALDYVKGIRPGDPVPRELLTREASWEPSDRHRLIAHQRLTIQLVSWLSGDEHVITNPDELQQVADDPVTRKKVITAFDEAAEKLGLGQARKHEVVEYLEKLTLELSYIECLRDIFHTIKGMSDTIQGLRKHYGHERSVLEIADPVARLMILAVKDLEVLFMQVDAQTCEIMGLLRNIDQHVAYIRMVRDELHKRMMAWDLLLEHWRGVRVEFNPSHPDLLREAYHFLAPRFMQVNEWVLVTKLHDPKEAEGLNLLGSDGKNKRVKFAKGVMKW